MAIHLPKPNKAPLLPPTETNFESSIDAGVLTTTHLSTDNIPLTLLGAGFNQSRFFDWQGRISRMQFLVYSIFNALFVVLGLAIMFVMMDGVQGIVQISPSTLPVSMLVLSGVGAAILGYLQLAVTKRRLNDINKTGWLALIMTVPVVNIFVYVYLLAAEGSEGMNYYGLPPRPAAKLKTTLMLVLPLLMMSLLGILTQVILPSYQALVKNKNTDTHPTIASAQPSQSVQPLPPTAPNLPASSLQPNTLRTEAVVIAGEQLGNGITSAPAPAPTATATPPMPATANMVSDAASMPAAIPQSNDQTLTVPPTVQASAQVAADSGRIGIESAPATTNKGTISYENFIKTSEQQIFIDHK